MPRRFKLPKRTPDTSSDLKERNKKKKASISMSLTELQFRAKKRGILFAGLSKKTLIDKLNRSRSK